jgi:hypothetical protein
LDGLVRAVPSSEKLYIGGDLNGHVGSTSAGFEVAHGGFSYGSRNHEGEDVLDFAMAFDLMIANHYPSLVLSRRCGLLPSAGNLPSRVLLLPSHVQRTETKGPWTVRDAVDHRKTKSAPPEKKSSRAPILGMAHT